MIKLLLILIIAFLWSFIDSYLPFIPPVTAGVSSFLLILNSNYVAVIMLGLSIGAGATFALWFYRKIVYKFENILAKKNVIIWRWRISKLVQRLGYRILVPFFATSLGAMVGYTYLLVENVNYKKYFIYATIGRMMLLYIFCAFIFSYQNGSYLPLLISLGAYIVLFIYTISLLLIDWKYIKKIFKEKNEDIY